ncbi:DUF4396 domain-containing protein [Amnibacterium sp.]|uniref:DUF4396 domain-containing protein n=1 Tax=Amnibacterium sp. TaxID=1872496 RepID=UPI003F7B3E6D
MPLDIAPESSVGDLPVWFTVLASASLAVAAVCAVVVTVEVVRRPARMAVMNVVWPVTMLFGGPIWLRLFHRHRRAQAEDAVSWRMSVAVGASHCGAGCALGDLIAEFAIAAIPALAAALGLGTLFSHRMFAAWILDYVVAYAIGIVFQYFAIAPMRGLSVRQGLWAAVKADTLSITAWQVGMYGTMAVLQLLVITPLWGAPASVFTPEFWFVMQLAMLGGFATAYPMNAWLIRKGVKERM